MQNICYLYDVCPNPLEVLYSSQFIILLSQRRWVLLRKISLNQFILVEFEITQKTVEFERPKYNIHAHILLHMIIRKSYSIKALMPHTYTNAHVNLMQLFMWVASSPWAESKGESVLGNCKFAAMH